MTIAFVNSNYEIQDSSPTSRAIPAPADIVPGNLLICIFTGHNLFTISSTPSGWTNLIVQDGGTDCTMLVSWKIATAGDVGTTYYTWVTSASSSGIEYMAQYSGVDTTSPINDYDSASTASGTSHATPSIITTVNGCMIISAFCADAPSSASWSGGGDNERVDQQTPTLFMNLAVYDSEQATAGSVSKTGTLSLSDVGATAIVALAPSTGTPSQSSNFFF